MSKKKKICLRPIDTIRIVDERGYAYLPKILRREVGVEGKDEIPFFVDANCVLLIRKGAKLKELLEGIEILKRDLILRSKQESAEMEDST